MFIMKTPTIIFIKIENKFNDIPINFKIPQN